MTATEYGSLAGCLGDHRVKLPLLVEDPDSGRKLRAALKETLEKWGVLEELIDAVVSVATEYWNNVVSHTNSEVGLLVARNLSYSVRIEVHDYGWPRKSETYPQVLKTTPQDESFRGLELVAALADTAAWEDTGHGLMRYADFALAPLKGPCVAGDRELVAS